MLSALRLCCHGQCKEWSLREGSGEVWGQRPAWIVSLSLSFAFLFVLSPPTTKAKHLTLSKTNTPYLLNSQCISCLVLPILVSGALKPRSQELTPTYCLPSLGTAICSLKLQNAPSLHPKAQCFVFNFVDFLKFYIGFMDCDYVSCTIVCLLELGISLIMQDLSIFMRVLDCMIFSDWTN